MMLAMVRCGHDTGTTIDTNGLARRSPLTGVGTAPTEVETERYRGGPGGHAWRREPVAGTGSGWRRGAPAAPAASRSPAALVARPTHRTPRVVSTGRRSVWLHWWGLDEHAGGSGDQTLSGRHLSSRPCQPCPARPRLQRAATGR